jgi:uncharacterized protein (TIGR01777 family)
MRKIAISGASGFIGSALASTLAAKEVTVCPLTRPGKTAKNAISWDPEAETIDAEGLRSCDALVHLAGESVAQGRWTEAQKARLRKSRLGTSELLLGVLRKDRGKIRSWISASAIGFYGNRGDEALTESSAPGDDFLAQLTRDWEAAVAPAQELGVRVACARFGVVLEPSGGALHKLLLPFKLGLGGRLGDGHQYMSWIAREDAVRALEFLLERDTLSGAFNVTAPTPVSNREFTAALGKALHRPTLLPVPGFALRLGFGEFADTALLGGARVLPQRLLDAGFTFREPDLQAYLARLLA